ncbi:MAG: quinone-dependent dihydroorotate dehydrogenase [Balneolales bacterium]
MNIYKYLVKPVAFQLDSENAHNAAMRLARAADDSESIRKVTRFLYDYQSKHLKQTLLGLDFRNPMGVAPGFDKNGTIPLTLEALGFGFTETGSITAHPSQGNPRPRLFRLKKDRAIINRMGLNNNGAEVVVNRLMSKTTGIPKGINIAKTHDPDITGNRAIDDYLKSYRIAEPAADYIMLNISCPNTAEGKTFEQKKPLTELLNAVYKERTQNSPPLLVKFSPDIPAAELTALLDITERFNVDGYAAVNTSSSRKGLRTNPDKLKSIGAGGLSGRPLHQRSCAEIKHIRQITGPDKTIIGIGGVDSFQAALDKIENGADLLQVYSALIYEGPGLIKRINKQLSRHLQKNNLNSIRELRRV